MAGAVLGGDLAFVGGFVGEHGLADDVADGEDVGDVGALLFVDRDEPAFVDEHPGGSAPITRPLGRRPTATSTLSNTAVSGALVLSLLAVASKVTVSPSGPAVTAVTLVPSQIAS